MSHACAGIDKAYAVQNSRLVNSAALTAVEAPCLTDTCLTRKARLFNHGFAMPEGDLLLSLSPPG